MRRIWRVVVIGAMVCAMMLAGAAAVSAAQTGQCGKNITWTLDDAGTLTLKGDGAMYNYDDDTYSPFRDVSVNENVKKIVVSEGITAIGSEAFWRSNATTVTLPNTLKTIGQCAFFDSKITSIVIPAKVKTIEPEVFFGCDQLTSAEIKGTIPNFGRSTFSFCKALETVRIANGNTVMPEGVFASCWALRDIQLPKSLKRIEFHAFFDCPSLKSLTVPSTIEYIATYPFGYIKDPQTGEINRDPDFVLYGYSGTVAHEFCSRNEFPFSSIGKVKPPKPSITKLKKGKASFDIEWKTNDPANPYGRSYAEPGYSYVTQIQFSLKSNFKKATTVKGEFTSASVKDKTIKSKKKYYVRVRVCKEINGEKYYSNWSKAKTVKTK